MTHFDNYFDWKCILVKVLFRLHSLLLYSEMHSFSYFERILISCHLGWKLIQVDPSTSPPITKSSNSVNAANWVLVFPSVQLLLATILKANNRVKDNNRILESISYSLSANFRMLPESISYVPWDYLKSGNLSRINVRRRCLLL